jgi:hypothetical protein
LNIPDKFGIILTTGGKNPSIRAAKGAATTVYDSRNTNHESRYEPRTMNCELIYQLTHLPNLPSYPQTTNHETTNLCKTKPICRIPKLMQVTLKQRITNKNDELRTIKTKPNKPNQSQFLCQKRNPKSKIQSPKLFSPKLSNHIDECLCAVAASAVGL